MSVRGFSWVDTPVDAVLVDLDGTMVDTIGDFVAALDRTLDDFSLPRVDRALIERLIGKGGEHLARSVLEESLRLAEQRIVGASPPPRTRETIDAMVPAVLRSYRGHYQDVNGRYATVYPGVETGLARLQFRGLKLACVTNKPTLLAEPLLRAKGLDRFFAGIFGGDRFERLKPDPMPLVGSCEAIGSRPGRTLMVGDSSNDADAARAAGCPVVLVTYGYNHGEPVYGANADGFVDSIAELAAS